MPFWSVSCGPTGVKRGRGRLVMGWGTARVAWYRRWGADGRTYGRASARPHCVGCAGNGRAATADATAAILQWLRRRACRLGVSGSTPGGGILDVLTPVQGPMISLYGTPVDARSEVKWPRNQAQGVDNAPVGNRTHDLSTGHPDS